MLNVSQLNVTFNWNVSSVMFVYTVLCFLLCQQQLFVLSDYISSSTLGMQTKSHGNITQYCRDDSYCIVIKQFGSKYEQCFGITIIILIVEMDINT